MNLRKRAFTLTEILIVMTIVGFILIAQLSVLSSKINKYDGTYYRAYHTLHKAGYNILADMYCPGPSCPDASITQPRSFPTTTSALCARLAEWLNITTNNCNNNAFSHGNITEKSTAHLIASNGFKIYIGAMGEKEVSNGQKIKYFPVYVDINGEAKPNRTDCVAKSDVLPDIVPFAVTTRGETIPMGFPKYSKKYMTAKVKLPNEYTTSGGTNKIESKNTKTLSFFEAALASWPKNNNYNAVSNHFDIPFSQDYDSTNLHSQCYQTISKATLLSDAKSIIDSYKDKGCNGTSFTCRAIIDKPTSVRY